jgi:hypothetical protein
MVARFVTPASRIAATSAVANVSGSATVSPEVGVILVSMLKCTPLSFASANTSVSLGMRVPSTATCVGNPAP